VLLAWIAPFQRVEHTIRYRCGTKQKPILVLPGALLATLGSTARREDRVSGRVDNRDRRRTIRNGEQPPRGADTLCG
jgi:hypothetical protein